MSESLRLFESELASFARVRAAHLPTTHREVITVYLKTGSRYETAAQAGLSHYLEHMLFRGTKLHPSAHALATAFEDLGGTLEATTGTDYGTLAIAVPPESFSDTLGHLAEVVLAPLLVDLESERSIIQEEILEELDDQGRLIHAVSLGRSLLFPGHGMGRLITGSLETLSSFQKQDLEQHHARTYVGAGMSIALAGPVCPEQALAEVEARFATLPRGIALDEVAPGPMTGPSFEFVSHKGSSQTRVYVAFRATGYHDRLDPALEMLLRILDDGLSTRLYHRLCDESGLCYDVSGSYEAFSDSGVVEIIADTAHERAPLVLGKILELLGDLAAHGPTERELERARKRARWQHQAVLDDPAEIADYLAFASLSGTAARPSARLAELEAVSLEDVRDAAASVFGKAQRAIVLVGLPKSGALDKARAIAL